ncbi:MAG: pilus assembly protein PilP [Oligoflexia bacterium]|nr:pilus assembly protein PilP [Oligoflexia bacterium]
MSGIRSGIALLIALFGATSPVLAQTRQLPLTVGPDTNGQTPGTSAAAAATATAEGPLSEDIMKLRDPFKRPVIRVDAAVPKTVLERFGVETFKLVGVLTGPQRMRAVLLDPEGKSHIISEKVKIGLKQGMVVRIEPRRVKVRERMTNIFGQLETVESEIPLFEKNTQADIGKVSIGRSDGLPPPPAPVLPPSSGGGATYSPPGAIPATEGLIQNGNPPRGMGM